MFLRKRIGATLLAGVAIAAIVSAVAPANAAAMADTARSAAVVRSHVTGPASRPATVVGSAAAVAAVDSPCYNGYMCFWFGPSYVGSRVGYKENSDDSNLVDNYFVESGVGQGEIVANNSWSYRNYNGYYTAVVCQKVNYGGPCLSVKAGTWGNFPAGYRDGVESFYWTNP